MLSITDKITIYLGVPAHEKWQYIQKMRAPSGYQLHAVLASILHAILLSKFNIPRLAFNIPRFSFDFRHLSFDIFFPFFPSFDVRHLSFDIIFPFFPSFDVRHWTFDTFPVRLFSSFRLSTKYPTFDVIKNSVNHRE